MHDQVKRSAVRGIGWSFLSSTSVRLLQIITTLVLAKLLAPSDFGIYALAVMITNAAAIFSETGFAQVLVYLKGDIRRSINTAFTLSLMLNGSLGILLILAAPLIGKGFDVPEIASPIRVLAVALMAAGALSVPMALLDKEMLFKKRAVVEVAGTFTYAALSISLAAIGFGVWSMVIGWTAMTVVNTFAVWIVSPRRPALGISREQVHDIFNYGKHLVVGVLAAFAVFQIDKAAVGKLLGVQTLGFYTIAFTVCSLPATNITAVINRVMFPAYSKLRDDPQEVRKIYLQTIKHLATIAFPLTAGLLLLSGPVIQIFYGEKWVPAIPIFHVLAFYGLIRAVGATSDAIFMSTGRTDYVRKVSMIQLIVGAVLVYPVTVLFGVVGVAGLFTFAYLAGTIYGLWRVQQVLGIGISGWVTAMRPPAVGVCLAGFAAWLVARCWTVPAWTTLICAGAALCAVYTLSMAFLDRTACRELRSLLVK